MEKRGWWQACLACELPSCLEALCASPGLDSWHSYFPNSCATTAETDSRANTRKRPSAPPNPPDGVSALSASYREETPPGSESRRDRGVLSRGDPPGSESRRDRGGLSREAPFGGQGRAATVGV